MVFHPLPLILAGIISIADYITEHIFSKKLRTNQKLVSFSAGVAISYIILRLFPEISSYTLIDGKKIFLYALFGFVSLNLIEQYIYKGVGRLKSLSLYHKNAHIAYFFVYNLLIGIVMVPISSRGLSNALLFFIPFLLYIIVEILPREFEFKNTASKVLYSFAPLIGAVFGVGYADFAASIFGELISFITGTLLYIVIRESLPSEEAEKPLYFIIGVLFYTLAIYMTWSFV